MIRSEDVLAAVHRRSAALVTKDIDALRALHHPAFLYVNADGEVLDRDAYLARYVLPDDVRWTSQTVLEPAVAATDAAAVVTFLAHDVARAGEYELDHTFRTTQTWVWTDDGWRCLAGHTSSPA
jgi:hypothetical protein